MTEVSNERTSSKSVARVAGPSTGLRKAEEVGGDLLEGIKTYEDDGGGVA
jgi:hypothetical protein